MSNTRLVTSDVDGYRLRGKQYFRVEIYDINTGDHIRGKRFNRLADARRWARAWTTEQRAPFWPAEDVAYASISVREPVEG